MAAKEDAGDLEPENVGGFKAPAPKSLDEIKNADKNDASLEKYKDTLLGGAGAAPPFPDNPKNVIVQKIQIRFENDQHPPAELNLLDADLNELKKMPIVIKEGVNYQICVYFFVQRDIVSGLRYVQATYKMGVRVSKDDIMVGSYPPKSEPHVYVSENYEAPTGMISRGSYSVKSRFTDDDKNDHLTWEWVIKIKDSWKD